jgi:hypothetical protein
VIFVVVSASFYGGLASRVPGIDVSDPELRAAIAPLNPPKAGVPADQVAAAKEASVEAFRLASILSAVLLVGGSAANLFGLQGEGSAGRAAGRSEKETDRAAAPPGP